MGNVGAGTAGTARAAPASKGEMPLMILPRCGCTGRTAGGSVHSGTRGSEVTPVEDIGVGFVSAGSGSELPEDLEGGVSSAGGLAIALMGVRRGGELLWTVLGIPKMWCSGSSAMARSSLSASSCVLGDFPRWLPACFLNPGGGDPRSS